MRTGGVGVWMAVAVLIVGSTCASGVGRGGGPIAGSSTSPTPTSVDDAAAATTTPVPMPRKVLQTVELEDTYDVDLLVDGSELWVAGPTGSFTVLAIDGFSEIRSLRVPGFEAGNYVALTPTKAWMSLNGSHDLVVFDRVTGKAHGVAMGTVRSMFIATEGERVFTAYSDIDDRIARVSTIDGASEVVTARADVADVHVSDIVRCASSTWLVARKGRDSGQLIELSESLTRGRTIALGMSPPGLSGSTASACADETLWLIGATGGDDPTAHLAAVDARTGQMSVFTELGPGAPASVVPVGEGAVVLVNTIGARPEAKVVTVDSLGVEVGLMAIGPGRAFAAVIHGDRLIVEHTPPEQPSRLTVLGLEPG